jgi:hypothetical protein
MRHRVVGTMLASWVVAAVLALPAMTHEGPAKISKYRGEVLDLACYASHDGKGPGHAECARTCAKGGQPMGLLAEHGTVYVLFADHDDPKPYNDVKEHAGKKVEVEGTLATKGALKGITIRSVKGL